MGMTVVGVGGRPVTVEAFVGRGLPSLIVTGLPGATVQDARERIRPAVEHAGFEWPLRRVVVPTPGIMSVVIAAVRARYRAAVVPEANAVEAAQVGGIDVVPVATLDRAVAYLRGGWEPSEAPGSPAEGWQAPDVDLADV